MKAFVVVQQFLSFSFFLNLSFLFFLSHSLSFSLFRQNYKHKPCHPWLRRTVFDETEDLQRGFGWTRDRLAFRVVEDRRHHRPVFPTTARLPPPNDRRSPLLPLLSPSVLPTVFIPRVMTYLTSLSLSFSLSLFLSKSFAHSHLHIGHAGEGKILPFFK